MSIKFVSGPLAKAQTRSTSMQLGQVKGMGVGGGRRGGGGEVMKSLRENFRVRLMIVTSQSQKTSKIKISKSLEV